MASIPLDLRYQKCVAWAIERGVQINGVMPAQAPGRGLGVFAQRNIKAGEVLVNVPRHALMTITDVPAAFQAKHGNITVHGLLASYLANGSVEDLAPYAEWRASWPSYEDFKNSMPMFWPHELRKRINPQGTLNMETHGSSENLGFFALPPVIAGRWNSMTKTWDSGFYQERTPGLLEEQEKKLNKDWETVKKAFSNPNLDTYVYYWLIVNTRSFYYEPPHAPKPADRNDCMALCPFADFFNHADSGVDVTFEDGFYTFTSEKDYSKFEEDKTLVASLTKPQGAGDEILFSYGYHSNDILLTEYGFVLEENEADYLRVDDVLLSQMNKRMKNRLKEANYLGNYKLSKEGVCFRTEMAVHARTVRLAGDWKSFVTGRRQSFGCPEDQKRLSDYISQSIATPCYEDAETALLCFERSKSVDGVFPGALRDKLVIRWKQILALARGSLAIQINGVK